MNQIMGENVKYMTLKQVAEVTKASYRTVADYAQKAGWTENGKKTLLNEKQVTIILEAMKQGHGGGAENAAGTLRTSLQGLETSQSRACRIAILANQQHKLDEQIKAELKAEIAELQEQNTTMKPKADYYDTFIESRGLTSIRDTCKELKIKEKQFVQYLIEKKYVYRDRDEEIKPYADMMDFFEVKDFVSGKTGFFGSYTLLTVKGKEHFGKKIKEINAVSFKKEVTAQGR